MFQPLDKNMEYMALKIYGLCTKVLQSGLIGLRVAVLIGIEILSHCYTTLMF